MYIRYGKEIPGFLYINRINSKLLVISAGSGNPFEFIDVLNKAIAASASKIKSKVVEVYLDLLSCLGDRSNRFAKMIYNQNTRQIDPFSLKNIKKETLP